MEVIVENKQTVQFESVLIGDTFIDEENFGTDVVLMRIKPNNNYGSNIAIKGNIGYAGYAVNLSDGMIYGYLSHEKVCIVKSTLTATR